MTRLGPCGHVNSRFESEHMINFVFLDLLLIWYQFAGVSNTSTLYKRGIRICTGTGIGAALSTCIQSPYWYVFSHLRPRVQIG